MLSWESWDRPPTSPTAPPSHPHPSLHTIPADASAPASTSLLSTFPLPPSTLSLRLPRSSPYFGASCVTLLMTLRKHAVSTSSEPPGHGYISWLTEQAHCHVNPSSLLGGKMREAEGEGGRRRVKAMHARFLYHCLTHVRRGTLHQRSSSHPPSSGK